MKLKNRLLNLVLAIIAIMNTSACSLLSTENELNNSEMSSNLESNNLGYDFPPIEGQSKEISELNVIIDNSFEDEQIEVLLKESLYDEDIEFMTVMQRYFATDFDERESLKNDYLRALYMFLLNTGVDIKNYLPCLKNLAIMQINPSCVSGGQWYQLFGSLLKASEKIEYPSLYEMYIDLALYIHELSCTEIHQMEKFGIYECPNLQDEFKSRRIYNPNI